MLDVFFNVLKNLRIKTKGQTSVIQAIVQESWRYTLWTDEDEHRMSRMLKQTLLFQGLTFFLLIVLGKGRLP